MKLIVFIGFLTMSYMFNNKAKKTALRHRKNFLDVFSIIFLIAAVATALTNFEWLKV